MMEEEEEDRQDGIVRLWWRDRGRGCERGGGKAPRSVDVG
jgi:hypothetical protein